MIIAELYKIFDEVIEENESDQLFSGPESLPKTWIGVKKYLGLNPFWVKDNDGKFPKLVNFSKKLYDCTETLFGDIEEYIVAIYQILTMVNKKRCCVLIDAIVITFYQDCDIFKDFIEYIVNEKNICLYIPSQDANIFKQNVKIDPTKRICEISEVDRIFTTENWIKDETKPSLIFLVNRTHPSNKLKLPYTKPSSYIYDKFNLDFYRTQLKKYQEIKGDETEVTLYDMIEFLTEEGMNQDIKSSYNEFYNKYHQIS